jgi:uncharacterized protein (TIGR03546 family)
MLSLLAKLLKILNSEAEPSQISLAFGFALISGFLSFFSPFNLLILLLVLFFRVNLSAYILGTVFFSGVAYLLDPLFHRIGFSVLTLPALEGLWTSLYGSTLWRIQRFNNSVVMGGIVFSLLFFMPLVLASNVLVRKYRERVLVWVRKTRLMQLVTASKLYSFYEKLA